MPWLMDDLHTVAAGRVVVAAASPYTSRLAATLPIAVRAAAHADTLAAFGKPGAYVLYLATATEYAQWFNTGTRSQDELGQAVPLTSNDIEVVVRMPAAADTRQTGPGGLTDVIFHEFGHVATLQTRTAPTASNPDADDTFVEGIAEYCAYAGHPASWAAPRLADVRAYLRATTWNDAAFAPFPRFSTPLATSARYGIGYLTIRRLVARYGLARTLQFWGQTEHQPNPSPAAASLAVLHQPWTQVNADIAHYIRETVHD
jgi:hypothetical protein